MKSQLALFWLINQDRQEIKACPAHPVFGKIGRGKKSQLVQPSGLRGKSGETACPGRPVSGRRLSNLLPGAHGKNHLI